MPALLTGQALVFARALGEYGATVRLSGNIPISTQLALVYTVGEVERVAPTLHVTTRDHNVDGPAPAVAHAMRASLRGRMLGRRNPGLPHAWHGELLVRTASRRCAEGTLCHSIRERRQFSTS